jgi:tetratricopeptide (TPR) repeat protein
LRRVQFKNLNLQNRDKANDGRHIAFSDTEAVVLSLNFLRIMSVLGRSLFLALVSIALSTSLVFAQTDEGAEDPVAIFNAGQELHERGEFAEAVKRYEKALELVPEFPEAEYQRGAALLSLGRRDEAEASFRRALGLRPEWTLAMTSLGSLLVTKDPAAAGAILEKVIKAEPQNSLALTALTELRLKAKAPPQVIRELLAKVTSLTSGKANPPASLWAARAALESSLGFRSESRTSLANALAIDPKNKNILAQTADTALADGDVLKAKVLTERLKAASGDTPEAAYLDAAILAHEGKAAEALKILDQMSAPTAAAAELRDRLRAATTSSSELEKLLEADPRNAGILGRLCVDYRRADPAKAVDYCRRANAAEPDNVNHAVGYAAALVQAKQFDAAAGLLKRILAIAPDHATVHANLGAALFQQKRYAEAKAEFRWLTDKQPKEPAAYYFLAISHDQLGEYIDALANYQQYLRLADPARDLTEIEKVKLRLPQLERLVKDGKGSRRNEK